MSSPGGHAVGQTIAMASGALTVPPVMRDRVPAPRAPGHAGRSCADGALGGHDTTIFPGDECLRQLTGDVVGVLDRRALHEVRRRALERAGNAVVQGELGAAHRVDYDAGRGRRVP